MHLLGPCVTIITFVDICVPIYQVFTILFSLSNIEKSRIRESKHLSTDADSSTDAIGGSTKNTPKPDFLLKTEKNHPKSKNSKMSRNMPKLAIRPSTRGL